MKYLKPLLLESKRIGFIYHFTSEINCFMILDEMKIKSSNYYDDDSDFWLKDKYNYRISFTRNKNLWKDLNMMQKREGNILFNTRLKFDGDILSSQYKITPHDDNYKRDNRFKDSIRNSLTLNKRKYDLGDEAEERLYSNKEKIDISKSLKEITIFKEDYNDYIKWYDSSKLKDIFITKCKLSNIKLNIFLKNEKREIEIV